MRQVCYPLYIHFASLCIFVVVGPQISRNQILDRPHPSQTQLTPLTRQRSSLRPQDSVAPRDSSNLSQINALPHSLGDGDSTGVTLRDVKYQVGFDPAVYEIIAEVKYLEQVGFSVPHDAKYVAMLEETYVLSECSLKLMMAKFHETLMQLNDAQVCCSDSGATNVWGLA